MPRNTLFVALFVVFLDFFGIGLIFPIASLMMFDTNFPLLPLATSDSVRGFWLGAYLILMPLCQFFAAPIWGASSDVYGRRVPLMLSLILGLIGYILNSLSLYMISLWGIILARFIVGFSSGNISIVQAAISDLSSPEEKAKRYGLLGMALGAGFTLGPFTGGLLTEYGYHVPFTFTSILIFINVLVAYFFFDETLKKRKCRSLSFMLGLRQLTGAFKLKGVRLIFLGMFLHNLGWSIFFEFIPVYFLKYFDFTSKNVSAFYGVTGGLYAISSGLLIRPFVARFTPLRLFSVGNIFGAGGFLLILLMIPTLMWISLIPSVFFIAFCMPSATTYISNNVSEEIQGEALGTLSSVDAAAMVLAPIVGGSIVGKNPAWTIALGSCVMIIAGVVVLIGSLRRSVATQ